MTARVVAAMIVLAACAREDVRSSAAATTTTAPTVAKESVVRETKGSRPSGDSGSEGASPTEPPSADARLTAITLLPEDGELREQLATASSRAKADGKVAIVEMWASWCPPCKKVDALLADPTFTQSLAGVVLVRLDSDAWGEALDEAGFDAPTIPTFYAVDATGRPKGKPLFGQKWSRLGADEIATKLATLRDR